MSNESGISMREVVIKGFYDKVDAQGNPIPDDFKNSLAYKDLDFMYLSNSKSTIERELSNNLVSASVAGWSKQANGSYVLEYAYITSPRSIYFMGLQLDIDTGYLLLSAQQNSDSIILHNLYDFLEKILPSFDKDLFLYALEDLKLNSIGNKEDVLSVLGQLAMDSVSVIVKKDDNTNSICHEALNVTLDSRVSNNSKSSVSKVLDKETLGKLILGFVRDSIAVSYRLKRAFSTILASNKYVSENTRSGSMEYSYDYEDEDNVIGDIVFDSYNFNDSLSDIERNLYLFVPPLSIIKGDFSKSSIEGYIATFNGFQNKYKKVDEIINKEGMVYDKTSLDFDYNKIGKALKLYANLEELAGCSVNDEATEAYLTLREDYDIAKKKIKKTNLSDLVKGSYLTNVLKNKESLYGKRTINQEGGFFSYIKEVGALNKKFITILRSVLQRI